MVSTERAMSLTGSRMSMKEERRRILTGLFHTGLKMRKEHRKHLFLKKIVKISPLP